jgi:hypothetical protein
MNMEKMRLIGTLLLIVGALLLIIPPIAGAGLSAVLVVLALAALGGGAAAFWYDRKQVADESAEPVEVAQEADREQFKFYDVKFKKSFTSSTYEIRKKNNRYFAVSPSPFGSHECWRIIKSSKASSMMKKS